MIKDGECFLVATKEKIAAAFNEWMRRYTENPEQFQREWQSVNAFLAEKNEGKEPGYGQACAEYFGQLLGEASVETTAATPVPVAK